VVQIASVERLMARQFARACQIIKEAHLDADQNASSVLNVLKTELATVRSAQIRALELVDRMLFVMSSTTVPFAVANKDIQETHSPDATPFLVSSILKYRKIALIKLK
jgi:hypothetical protein